MCCVINANLNCCIDTLYNFSNFLNRMKVLEVFGYVRCEWIKLHSKRVHTQSSSFLSVIIYFLK